MLASSGNPPLAALSDQCHLCFCPIDFSLFGKELRCSQAGIPAQISFPLLSFKSYLNQFLPALYMEPSLILIFSNCIYGFLIRGRVISEMEKQIQSRGSWCPGGAHSG